MNPGPPAAERGRGEVPVAWRAGAVSAAVLLLAGLLAVPVQLRALEVARVDRDEARTARDEAVARESAAVLAVANEQSELARTRSARNRNARIAAGRESRTDQHTTQREAEEAAIADARAGAESAGQRLERISSILGLQGLLIAPLESCLRGVERANRALGQGDRAGAADVLGAVTGPCGQVRASSATPAFPYDFPDPHVVAGPDGRWWAYGTNSTGGAVQLISSADLADWRVEGNALADVPGWARPGATWAPAVVNHDGRWLLYYTVREHASGLQCISVATGESPAGPFHDTSTGPLVCERAEGGSIDPDPVVDADGRLHLLWKTELDTVGGAAELRGSLLDATGTELTGEVATLLRSSQPWEAGTIEGPAMLPSNGYHLLYSGGSWNGSGYAVGAARCESILGPCTPEASGPVLRSTGDLTGPGGLSVFRTPYGAAVAYHAWQGDEVGYPDNRYLHLGDVQVRDGSVVVQP